MLKRTARVTRRARTALQDNVLDLLAAVGLTAATPQAQGEDIDALLRLELDRDAARRGPDRRADVPPDRFGIALSGGGIRSATFNLGLLQALHGRGILGRAHYLSTVSGGSYIGGFWTAWRERNRGETFPSDPEPGRDRWAEHPAIRHLREFSNFLSPQLGLFSLDTGRMLAALVTGMVPSLLAALSLILLVLFAWGRTATRLLPPTGGAGADLATFGLLAALLGVVLAGAERAWRRREAQRTDLHPVQYALAATIAVVVAVAWHAFQTTQGWTAIQAVADVPVGLPGRAGALFLATASPAFACLAGVAVMVVTKWIFARRVPVLNVLFYGDAAQATIDRVVSRLLFAAAVWATVAAAWTLGVVLESRGMDAIGSVLIPAAGTGGAFGWLVRLYQRSRDAGGSRLLARLKPRLPQLLAYVTLALLVVGIAALVIAAAVRPRWGWIQWMAALPGTPSNLAALVYLAGIITLLTLVFFDPNRVGLHNFYRWRLARAYLGASNDPAGAEQTRSRRRKVELAEDDDMALDRVSTGTGPLHLVCCAANDLAADGHIANLHRGAESAVLSPVGFSVGRQWGAWRAADEKPWQRRLRLRRRRHSRSGGVWSVPTLGQAVTASAAAFNSQMGAKSMKLGPAAGFLLTALNLRLGLWLRHPRRRHEERRQLRLPPGWAFYKELFSQTSIHHSYVHLSDGGHFENMALYELIRRQCRYIIASDCGMDPDGTFNDLGNLVRKARADFGVEIDIDLEPLLRDQEGYAHQHMVAGDIIYPSGPPGVLLLFKPSLTGDESADIAQYHTRSADFPQETTGDQFYDEAQWEAYRRLGRHSVDEALGFLGADEELPPAALFAHARFEWLPRPPGFEAAHRRIAQGVAELDAALLKASDPTVTQVYRELNAIAHSPDEDRPTAAVVGNGGRADACVQLELVRRALSLMEDAYVSADLEHWAGHPLNLGLLNYFGRWASAPATRLWWPLLKPLHLAGFVRFMERRFGLPASGRPGGTRADVERVDRARLADTVDAGILRAWRAAGLDGVGSGGDAREEDATFVVYRLRLGDGNRDPLASVDAALLRCRVTDRVAAWPADHLFVPPGLWGAGIGADFLRRVTRPACWDTLDIRHFLAALERPTHDDHGARKAAADTVQLYRDAGFETAEADNDGWIQAADGDLIHVGSVLPAGAEDAEGAPRRLWFVREADEGPM